jgi:OPA family glycerol-3-phosphate transporter-like MFS transporter
VFARTFAITWIAYCGFYLCRKNFSVLMPYLKTEQGYSSEALAHVLFVYSVAYSLGQFGMGHIADRIGGRLVVTAGAVVSAVCSALTGMAFPLVAAQAVNGMAQASGWPGVLKLARDWFPAANLGVVMAWWGTHLVVGGFLATNLAAAATSGGWRRGAWVPSILLGLVAVAFGAFARDRESAAPDAPSAPAVSRAPLPLTRPLLAIAAMYFCVKMARYSFLFWLPLYMTEQLRYGPVQAGYASSIFELVGFGGVLAAGYASERVTRGARFPVGAVMMAGLALSCLAYPYLSRFGAGTNLAAVALIGVFTFGPDVLMAGAGTQEAAPPGMTGRAAGLVNGVGSAGQIISPYLVAGVSTHFGWDMLFVCLAGAALLGSAALATQWKRA